MLASTRLVRSRQTQRAAFTLVEVLVVVAIVVILASVGTIATLKFLADAKVDNARMSAMALVEAAKTVEVRNPDGNIDLSQAGVQALIPYLDKGEAGILDPWGQPYQITYMPTSTGGRRVFVFTVSPDDGRTYGWPKEFEPPVQ
ncbi:MAG: prepilin-type N-terminal cleavage/methylation domain-containing protein [Fimbriiglobus sp.]|jgi:general secretion pathway protein G|nr:prepilin-type N-terminal cleavage/methylation domain-containing protein [Fimbriiglobus sp.]